MAAATRGSSDGGQRSRRRTFRMERRRSSSHGSSSVPHVGGEATSGTIVNARRGMAGPGRVDREGQVRRSIAGRRPLADITSCTVQIRDEGRKTYATTCRAWSVGAVIGGIQSHT